MDRRGACSTRCHRRGDGGPPLLNVTANAKCAHAIEGGADSCPPLRTNQLAGPREDKRHSMPSAKRAPKHVPHSQHSTRRCRSHRVPPVASAGIPLPLPPPLSCVRRSSALNALRLSVERRRNRRNASSAAACRSAASSALAVEADVPAGGRSTRRSAPPHTRAHIILKESPTWTHPPHIIANVTRQDCWM